MANNLLMLGLSYFRRKLFEFQAFHNQAHIVNFTGIIIYFCGTYYLYAPPQWANLSLDVVELVSNQHLLYFGHNLYLRR